VDYQEVKDRLEQLKDLSPEQITHERNLLVNDTDIQKEFAAGDRNTIDLIKEVSRLCVGSPESWSSVPPSFGRTKENPTGDPSFSSTRRG